MGPLGQVDLLKALSELTILSASRCLHGEDVREHIFKDLLELYHDLDHGWTPLTIRTQETKRRASKWLESLPR
jgi:sterol 14-demethylase